MPQPSSVRIQALGHSWGSARALSDLDFEIARGEIFGIVGPDGAGKTTLMRILAAVTRPTLGDVWIAGRHTVRDPDGVHDVTGYVCQTTGLYSDLTVAENIRFAAEIRGVPRSDTRTRAERLLLATGLAGFERRRAGVLSGGMKQKLALVCSLLHRPEVLILDEPTNGVDPVSRREFWSILSGLAVEGVTIVLATTYLDEAEGCARSCLLSGGRALDIGTPAEIRDRSGLRIIEVDGAAAPMDLVAVLRGLPGVTVSLRSGTVRVAGTSPGLVEGAGEEARKTGGVGIRIARVPPTLEDVLAAGSLR